MSHHSSSVDEDAMQKGTDHGDAFSDSGSSIGDAVETQYVKPRQLLPPSDGARNRAAYRGALRIEVPFAVSTPCTSPASPAEVTATTTHRSSPRTAVYRNGEEDAFAQHDGEECTPTSVAEQSARQSALAILQADISARSYLAHSIGHESSRTAAPSPCHTVNGSFEMAEVPKKRAALQNFFTSRTRKQRSTLSSSSIAVVGSGSGYNRHLHDVSTHLDLTSGADQDSHSHIVSTSTPRPESGTSDPLVAQLLSESRMAPSVSSAERQQSEAVAAATAAGTTSSVPLLRAAGVPIGASPTDDDEADGSCSSSGQAIGMEAVLRDASKVRGIRLTWLLYLLITMVIVLFTLLLVQIIYESNRTLIRTATQAVRAQASTLVNSLDVEEYSLTSIFGLLRDLNIENFNRTTLTYALIREMFCARFYGAPMSFAMYNETGSLAWAMRCPLYPISSGYRRLPPALRPGVPQVQVTEYATDAALAIRTYYSDVNTSVKTYVILLDKDTLGRTIMGNSFPQYSSATLQYLTAGVFARMWNSSDAAFLFHTLTKDKPTYVSTQSGEAHDSLVGLYNNLCYSGSPYLWHAVAHFKTQQPPNSDSDDGPPRADLRWPVMTIGEIPDPHLEFGRSWGQLSVSNFCAVQCYGEAGDTECAEDNPTNIWFVVEYSLNRKIGLSSILNVVGVVSIVALILFSFVMFLAYLSITVPVNFLRVQLLKAVGANDTQSRFQRTMVRWTYRLWLGDLTAIVRSTHILSLCFRLNKKYVPDYVLRNHAQQLFLRRRKFNFLDDVDVKDDPTDRDDTESEGDLAQPLVPLPGVSPVMPSSESRFLWHFPDGNDSDEPPSPQMQQQPTMTDSDAADGAAAITSPTDAAVRPSAGDVAPPAPLRSPASAVDAHGLAANGFAKRSKPLKPSVMYASENRGAWPVGEVDVSVPEADFSMAASAPLNTRSLSTMAIRRDSESTILCVRIPSVELAYLMNYAAAVVQHRRIMRVLLHRIRRHKGALFHRSGDLLAAVWNAFESCPNHAETAAVCAQEIANAFAPFRADGLHIGVVLHQGVLVCGSVEYSKAAFVTAFGDGPREAFALADLAATVSSLNVLVTESVKQSLSGLYDCNIVDVVQLPTSAHPLLLFELGSRRGSLTATTPALCAQFAVEYARVFAHFRGHDFNGALKGIEHIRLSSGGCHNEHLLRRLERLSCFYATAPSTLPLPYCRAFPAWVNYEAIAQAGLKNDVHIRPQRSNSLLSRTLLDGVVYAGLPAMRNDVEYIKDFKQELQENMRRTARRGNCSSTMDESSTRPHMTPQPSPPMRPMADPTLLSEPLLSVDSGMEQLADHQPTNHNNSSASQLGGGCAPPCSQSHGSPLNASATTAELFAPNSLPKPRHVDVAEGNEEAQPDFSASSSPPVSTFSAPAMLPLLAFPAAHVVAEPAAEHASLAASSTQAADTPRDVLAMSNRFAATHGVTNRPPVALAAASPECNDLTAERVVSNSAGGGDALPHRGSFPSSGNNDEDAATNSIIQSAGMSFRGSVNNNGGLQGFAVQNGSLPSEITAKSGTKYLRSTRVLGKGSFGCVYLGMDAHSGRLVAIKFLPMPSDDSGVEDIEAEVLILQRVNDTHVVQLLSYAFVGDAIVVIMECMLAGSLQNMISAFGSIPSSTARVFMRDVLRGLSKIHSMGVIHRDVKPQNVLLSLAGNCKISDFGASAWLQELARKESRGQVCGTPVYLAPEAARGTPAKESDIWSCGIMFLQMITGALPYPQPNLSAGAAVLVFQIGSGIAQPRIPDDLDELDAEFVRACLQVEPSKRLTAAALLQLPIFTV